MELRHGLCIVVLLILVVAGVTAAGYGGARMAGADRPWAFVSAQDGALVFRLPRHIVRIQVESVRK